MMSSRLAAAVRNGDREGALDAARQALAEGQEPGAVFDLMGATMDKIGEAFQRNEVFVPELLVAARAMKAVIAMLEPRLVKADEAFEVNAVIGTVQGDLHDVGKSLVATMWRAARFDVIDLGTDVAAKDFAVASLTHKADIVGVSALLTTSMPAMQEVVAVVRASGRPGVAVVVGGAPVTAAFAEEIGADGFAPDAGAAVPLARELAR